MHLNIMIVGLDLKPLMKRGMQFCQEAHTIMEKELMIYLGRQVE